MDLTSILIVFGVLVASFAVVMLLKVKEYSDLD